MKPTPRPGILDIEAYVGGRAQAAGAARPIKLSSNESPMGPSPASVAAFHAASRKLELYPEGSAHILRQAVADAFHLDPARIVCGNGSGEILTLLAEAYVSPGDEVLYSAHAFLLYRIATLTSGGVPIEAPETNLHTDVDALLARVTPRTRIVYLANPNNPTGSYLPKDEVRRLHAGLRGDILLVIDAAYAEYVRRDDYDAGIDLVSANDNVIMTRTFSKAYALAGLRVGWAYCPPAVADVLNRIRGPFNVSDAAQAAAAAALQDRAYMEAGVAHNETWRGWLTDSIRALGLRVDDSVANFVLIHFADKAEANAADAFLCSHGLILRGMSAYALPHCLRLTIGSEDANRKLVAALSDFVKRK